MDWFAAVGRQGEIATGLAREIPRALSHPELTLVQASHIHGTIELAVGNFNQIADLMDTQDVEPTLYEAAELLSEIWQSLSMATINKLRAMQGLSATC